MSIKYQVLGIKYYLLSIKGIITTAIMIALLSNTGIVFAETATTGAGLRKTVATQVQEKRIDNLKTKGKREIDRRLKTLNNLLTRINESAKLSSTNKSSLTNIVQTEITNLNTLKSKIENDTDLETLRTDVKSIVDGYRVYLLVVPQVGLVVVGDNIITTGAKLSTISVKLSSMVTGITDTALLTQANTKITEAQTLAGEAQALVLPLLPSGYPGNKTTLQDARSKLAKARENLKMARKDIETVMKKIRKTTTGAIPATNSAQVR